MTHDLGTPHSIPKIRQAEDRAHRIGQKNPATVCWLVASGTVEERGLVLHKESLPKTSSTSQASRHSRPKC